jgi:hypothetical protein
MPLQNLNTGRTVQPYGGDPGEKIAGAMAGLGAALLRVGQWQQEQAIQRQQQEQVFKLRLAETQSKANLQIVQVQHDMLKFKMDQMRAEQLAIESGSKRRTLAETEMVDNAEFLPGKTLDQINTDFDKVNSIVLGSQFRSSNDLMAAFMQTALADKMKTFRGANKDGDEDTLKSGALAIARAHMDELQSARVERRTMQRALPVIPPTAQEFLAGRDQVGPPAPAEPLSGVPKPPPIGGVEITAIPQSQAELTAFLTQGLAPKLNSLARRDSQAAQAWFAQFVQYYNANRPADAQDLRVADFNRLVR